MTPEKKTLLILIAMVVFWVVLMVAATWFMPAGEMMPRL